jgi:hypothetical protein
LLIATSILTFLYSATILITSFSFTLQFNLRFFYRHHDDIQKQQL